MDKKWTRSTALFTASLLAALAGPLGAAQGRGEMAGAAARLADMAAEWGRNGPTPMIAESPLPEGPVSKGEPAKAVMASASSPAPKAKISLSPQEVSMIEHVVEREVHGASYAHKVAVANVIVNRVLASQFPNSVSEVLHAPNQFPVSIKNYYNPKWKPDADTINAVYAAVYQPDTTGGALYFYAPQYTGQKTAAWFERQLTYCFEMEGHRFFC